MYDTVAVQIANSTRNLPEIVTSKILSEIVFGSDFSEEAAVSGKLKEKINFFFIIKKSIHFKDVWVVGVHLNFDFLDQLGFHL